MGTRADFYIGRGPEAEWIGSIAMDGYPTGLTAPVLAAVTEVEFRARVYSFAARKDYTAPQKGWPWPWADSRTTDFAYAWDEGVWISAFGRQWVSPSDWLGSAGSPESDAPNPFEEPFEEKLPPGSFPDMRAVQMVATGARSGLITVPPAEQTPGPGVPFNTLSIVARSWVITLLEEAVRQGLVDAIDDIVMSLEYLCMPAIPADDHFAIERVTKLAADELTDGVLRERLKLLL